MSPCPLMFGKAIWSPLEQAAAEAKLGKVCRCWNHSNRSLVKSTATILPLLLALPLQLMMMMMISETTWCLRWFWIGCVPFSQLNLPIHALILTIQPFHYLTCNLLLSLPIFCLSQDMLWIWMSELSAHFRQSLHRSSLGVCCFCCWPNQNVAPKQNTTKHNTRRRRRRRLRSWIEASMI